MEHGDPSLGGRLEELKEHIRREIRKELKIKEGAENLRKVSTDKKSVANLVKKANTKLQELQFELLQLEEQILLTQGQGSDTSLITHTSHVVGKFKIYTCPSAGPRVHKKCQYF